MRTAGNRTDATVSTHPVPGGFPAVDSDPMTGRPPPPSKRGWRSGSGLSATRCHETFAFDSFTKDIARLKEGLPTLFHHVPEAVCPALVAIDFWVLGRYCFCRSGAPGSFIFEPTYFEAGADFCCRRHALKGEGESDGEA